MIEGWFDGVCEPKNPGGHAAWGALVKVNGQQVYAEGGYCGFGTGMSNNVAEYSGFLAALKRSLQVPGKKPIHIRGDSRLVVCHLDFHAARKLGYDGLWRRNGGLYMPYYLEARALIDSQPAGRVTLEWISRDNNDECDVLSKKVLLDKGIKFRIQPIPDQKVASHA